MDNNHQETIQPISQSIDQPQQIGNQQNAPPTNRAQSNKNAYVLLTTIVVACALGVAGYFIYQNNQQKNIIVKEQPIPTQSIDQKQITPTPTPDVGMVSNSSWYIELDQTSYYVDELSQDETRKGSDDFQKIPQTGGPQGVSGVLFTPLNEGELICSANNYNLSHFLEKKQGDTWVRLCDSTIQPEPAQALLIHLSLEKYFVSLILQQVECGFLEYRILLTIVTS